MLLMCLSFAEMRAGYTPFFDTVKQNDFVPPEVLKEQEEAQRVAQQKEWQEIQDRNRQLYIDLWTKPAPEVPVPLWQKMLGTLVGALLFYGIWYFAIRKS